MLPPLPSLPPMSSSTTTRIPHTNDSSSYNDKDDEIMNNYSNISSPEQSEPSNLLLDPNNNNDNTTNNNKNNVENKEALAFLLRYESMVRQQEAEDMACWFHVRPCLEQILALGSDDDDDDDDNIMSTPTKKLIMENTSCNIMERTISYKVLKRALTALELSSNVITTDRQLMMVLRTLTNKVVSSKDGGANNSKTDNMTLTWAEFLQCYKTVVNGMQTLQHLPGSSVERSRARDRTLSSLSLFQPPSTKLLNEHPIITRSPQTHSRSKREQPNNNNEINSLLNQDSTQWTANRQLKMIAEELGFVEGTTNEKTKEQRQRRLQIIGGIFVATVALLSLGSRMLSSSSTPPGIMLDDAVTKTAASYNLESTIGRKMNKNNVPESEAPTQLALLHHQNSNNNNNKNKNRKSNKQSKERDEATLNVPVEAPTPKYDKTQRQPALAVLNHKNSWDSKNQNNHHHRRSVSNDLQERLSTATVHDDHHSSPSFSNTLADDDATMEFLLQQNPHLGTTMKYRMVGSAVAGGLTGVALAPTVIVAMKTMIRQILTFTATGATATAAGAATVSAPVIVMTVSFLTIVTAIATPVGKGLRNWIRNLLQK